MHIILVFSILICASVCASPQVILSCGKTVVGAWMENKKLASFRSIPYATISQRFTHAKDVTCNDYVSPLNASQFGPICYQTPQPGFPPAPRPQNESCLSIDVYTRPLWMSSTKKRPVLFWIYGGSNVIGYSTFYKNLHSFALNEEALVVSINYRVGLFGYLALKQLSQEQGGHSGNYGISDIISALRWTQREISHFGGDPGRVMVLGQSSGGTNIFALQLSPSARGLFSAAVSLSGSANITMSLSAGEHFNAQQLAPTGCAGSPRCLRQLPPQTIAQLSQPYGAVGGMAVPSNRATGPTGWFPLVIVDGKIVQHSMEQYGTLSHVPTIAQSMSHDTAFMIPFNVLPQTVSEYRQWIYGNMTQDWGASGAAQVARLYAHEPAAKNQLRHLTSNIGVGCASVYLNQLSPASVYAVEVTAVPGNATGYRIPPGVVHTNCHLWDYFMAFEAYSMFGPISPSVASYTPTLADTKFGATLRRQWMDLVSNKRPRGLQTQCANEVGNGGQITCKNSQFSASCATLQALGFEQPLWFWQN